MAGWCVCVGAESLEGVPGHRGTWRLVQEVRAPHRHQVASAGCVPELREVDPPRTGGSRAGPRSRETSGIEPETCTLQLTQYLQSQESQ